MEVHFVLNVRIILQSELDYVFEHEKRGLSRPWHSDGNKLVKVNDLLKV